MPARTARAHLGDIVPEMRGLRRATDEDGFTHHERVRTGHLDRDRQRVGEGRLTQVTASLQLEITPRHLCRLIAAYGALGQWLMQADLWRRCQQRHHAAVHQPRYRCDYLGELIQIDGSHHHWFEDRGSARTLLAYIDDATGRLMKPDFMERFNAKFVQAPVNATDLHRPLTELDDLEEILSWRKERTVSNSLTQQHDRVVYLLELTELAKGLPHNRVRVHDYSDGTIAIKYQGVDLPYRVFVEPADIASNKRLGAVLQDAKDPQREHSVTHSTCVPTRRGQRRLAEECFRLTNPAVLQKLTGT